MPFGFPRFAIAFARALAFACDLSRTHMVNMPLPLL